MRVSTFGLEIGELGYGIRREILPLDLGNWSLNERLSPLAQIFYAWITNGELGFVWDYWNLGIAWVNIVDINFCLGLIYFKTFSMSIGLRAYLVFDHFYFYLDLGPILFFFIFFYF